MGEYAADAGKRRRRRLPALVPLALSGRSRGIAKTLLCTCREGIKIERIAFHQASSRASQPVPSKSSASFWRMNQKVNSPSSASHAGGSACSDLTQSPPRTAFVALFIMFLQQARLQLCGAFSEIVRERKASSLASQRQGKSANFLVRATPAVRDHFATTACSTVIVLSRSPTSRWARAPE